MMGGDVRLLFRISNRRGLGHFMRGLNIAREIVSLSPRARVLFFVQGSSPEAMREPWLQIVQAPEDDSPLVWQRCLVDYSPQTVIYDTMLPKPSETLPGRGVALAYIMRKCQKARQLQIFAEPLLRRMDCLLVPHTREEFAVDIPASLARKTSFVGPIVRLPDPQVRAVLRDKYQLRPDVPLLVSTPGGGGFAADATFFLQVVERAHELLLRSESSFRHLVILGPKHQGTLVGLPGMQVVDCEPELGSLLAEATLVFSAGGYNTVHEIRAAAVPAVFLPGPRTHDDQFERVQSLAEQGLAVVVDNQAVEPAAQRIANLLLNRDELESLHQRCTKKCLVPGNRQAAKLILQLVPS